MEQFQARHVAVIAIGGLAFYYLYSNLVGVAAAIAAPEWFIPFMREHRVLGLILFALATTVPAAAIGAVVSGFVLSRLVEGRYFLIGLLTVCVAVLVATISADYSFGFIGDLRRNTLPSNWIDVPMIIALWLFLPLSMVFFGRRRERGRD